MGKKVRQRMYTTKKQFSDDLYLIWENCLTYNSDPVCDQLPHNLETLFLHTPSCST
jgi:transcriptional activator SPT7